VPICVGDESMDFFALDGSRVLGVTYLFQGIPGQKPPADNHASNRPPSFERSELASASAN
jgi:hypothetical protein